MFEYGKVYSLLPDEGLKHLKLDVDWNPLYCFLAKLYFKIFGYPDVAGHMRYRIIKKLLSLKKGQTVLDAGCGNGIYLHEYSRRFQITGWGVDGKADRVKMARAVNKLLGHKNKFRTSLLERLELGEMRFDKILCLEVLEHIKDDLLVLKKLRRYLKNDGVIVITVPKKGTALPQKLEENPYFEPEPFEHVRSGYKREELYDLARQANLRIVTLKPYFFLFSRYATKVQQFLYKRKLTWVNLLLSPILTLIALFDDFIQVAPRGYIFILKR